MKPREVLAFRGIARAQLKAALKHLDSLSNTWAPRLADQVPPLFDGGQQASVDAVRTILANQLLAKRFV